MEKVTCMRYRCTECDVTVDTPKEAVEMLKAFKMPHPGPCPKCSKTFTDPKFRSGKIEDLHNTTLVFEKEVQKTQKQHENGEKGEE